MSDAQKKIAQVIAQIRVLVERATSGPWVFMTDPEVGDFIVAKTGYDEGGPTYDDVLSNCTFEDGCDGEFIAASRDAVPALLAELDRLTRENVELRSLVEEMKPDIEIVARYVGTVPGNDAACDAADRLEIAIAHRYEGRLDTKSPPKADDVNDDKVLQAAEDWATSRDPIHQDRSDHHILKAVGVARRLQDDLHERNRMLALCCDNPRDEDADRIGTLEDLIRETLALAGCAHLADDHGHQRCDALPADHDGRRHPYTRPRMLDALAAAIGET